MLARLTARRSLGTVEPVVRLGAELVDEAMDHLAYDPLLTDISNTSCRPFAISPAVRLRSLTEARERPAPGAGAVRPTLED